MKRVRVRVYRTVKRVVRRHGRRITIRKRVAVYRVVKVHGKKHRVPAYATRVVAAQSSKTVDSSTDVVTLTPRRECMEIVRADEAARWLKLAIPAVRAAAPDVKIDIGDTSPVAGVDVFIAELATQHIPVFDGWAHHPYSGGVVAFRQMLTGLFGPSIDLDLTEFGAPRSIGDADAKDRWDAIGADACAAHARSLVAYQWVPESGAGWDTSLMDDGLAETPQSQAFAAIHC